MVLDSPNACENGSISAFFGPVRYAVFRTQQPPQRAETVHCPTGRRTDTAGSI